MKENKIIIISNIIFIIINVLIVYFGRMYYPYNFNTDTASFFENLIALVTIEGWLFIIFIGLPMFFYSLYKYIKTLS